MQDHILCWFYIDFLRIEIHVYVGKFEKFPIYVASMAIFIGEEI